MKRLLTVITSIGLISSLLVGCGQNATEQNEVSSGTAQETTEGTVEELDHIIMTYLTTGKNPADLKMVEEEVNKISREAINVEVEFKPVSIPETFSQYSLWVSSGEEVDLMMNAFQGVANYANNGSIIPLNELIEKDAPKIKELMDEFPIVDGAVIDGEIYGITPVGINYGVQGSLIMRNRELEAAGIELKETYTLEDFTEIFSAVKATNPDIYPYGVLGSDLTTGSLFGFYSVVDGLGASMNSGVLMGTDSTEIVNLYETEEYYNYLKLVRSWYEAGYIMPDAATTISLKDELILSDVICSYAMYNKPEQVSDASNQYGEDFSALTTTDVYYTSATPASGTYWTIPITSKNPEAAMRFLNLMYEEHDLANLILYGIEGEHYVKTQDEGIIAFPEGIDAATSRYNVGLGLYGDRRYEYAWTLGNSREVNEAFTQKAMSNPTKAVGYSYDSSNMTNQLVAIDAVTAQYLPSLETGSVDVDSIYPDFIKALKNAGIDDVIEDNQRQFDAWLEQQ